MKGTRPLDNNEIRLVSACFDGTFEVRQQGDQNETFIDTDFPKLKGV